MSMSSHLSPQPRGSFFNTPSISMTSQTSTIVSGKSEEWFSLEGYLSLKWHGAFNFLHSKKKFYFGLDEFENRLVYYKDKNDFNKRANRIGVIILKNSACTVADNNPKGFIIHADDKKYELEADNDGCASCWLQALQYRKDINDNTVKDTSLPNIIWSNIRRRRSRSGSSGSDEEKSDQIHTMQKPRKIINRKSKSFKYIKLLAPQFLPSVDASKLRRMKSDNPDKPRMITRGDSTTSTQSIENDAEIKPPKICIPPSPLPMLRKKSAPLWLNDYVTSWIHEQRQIEACSVDAGSSHDTTADSIYSKSSPGETTTSSSTTSTYNSEDNLNESICSDTNKADELITEVTLLRLVNDRQKEQIEQLNGEKRELLREVERLRQITSYVSNGDGNNQSAQNKFLNSEILRLNDRHHAAEKKLSEMKKDVNRLESEMDSFKKEYVFLLQSCVRIPLYEHSGFDVVQVKLFGGNVHEHRVRKLLAAAREVDPTLPTFESLRSKEAFHIDEYGFRHYFEGTPLALHYICTMLHQHYQSQSDCYVQRKQRWQMILNEENCFIENNHESRLLCRAGIPRSMRSRVWRVLINQQVADIKSKYGNYYYRNLCQSQGTAAEKQYINVHQKQINLDLLRTMPNNLHFMSATCKGVTQLQSILRAYCLHNPTLGYCQGMNFIAATALLFVSPEDAFWFLVAITEKLFDASYFDQSLTGAQADQEVLKEILERRYPRLAHHLEEHDIDLTTITLNWFLAIFFDAVPFQTMLRIWDIFLLEGSKILFRISIALLGLCEEEILARSDTISVIKVLKAAVKLTYDADGLIQHAFDELHSFPSKTQLAAKQKMYLTVLQDRLMKRQQIRDLLGDYSDSKKANSDKLCDLPVDCIVFSSGFGEDGLGYVTMGNQKRGKVALITLYKEGAANLNIIDLEFDCKPVSMVIYESEMAFISLLSGYIVAIHLNNGKGQILWELKLNDVALKLIHSDNKLYAALANGTLTVLEDAFNKAPSVLDFYHIPISAAPITDAFIDDENLYLAVACKIVILNKNTLSPLGNIYVAASAAGSTVPMFEKIRALSDSEYGIWVITAHSSLIQLWKDSQCQLLFDVTYDHSHRKPSFDEHDELETVEINTILYFENEIWIGTVDGYLMLYRVEPNSDSKSINNNRWDSYDSTKISNKVRPNSSNEVSFSLHKYPPGKRLSPINNHSHLLPVHRQNMYYIPTLKETQVEEHTSERECSPKDRETRKISVIIDQNTKKYSVSVAPVHSISVSRSISIDSANETMKSPSLSSKLSFTKPSSLALQRSKTFNRFSGRPKMPVEKTNSIDSAVSSVFDGELNVGAKKSPTKSFGSDDCFVSNVPTIDECAETPLSEHQPESTVVKESPVFSTGESMEYDDMFEVYSENDTLQNIGLIEEDIFDRSPPPSSKLVQIPVRKMSFNAFGPCELSVSRQASTSLTNTSFPYDLDQKQDGNDSPTEIACPSQTSQETSVDQKDLPKLRRKDLDFDDPIVVAYKDNVADHHISEEPINDLDSNVEESEIKCVLTMNLQMKIKISDKPVRCITLTKCENENIVITGAGNYGDEEAILRWRKEKTTGLWINDPLVDINVHGRRRTIFGKLSN